MFIYTITCLIVIVEEKRKKLKLGTKYFFNNNYEIRFFKRFNIFFNSFKNSFA